MSVNWYPVIDYDKCIGCMACSDMCRHGVYKPDAVRLMRRKYGIDMESSQHSKLLKDIPQPDVVIFMGCNVSCPYVAAQYAENWGLEDPTGQADAVFMKVMEQIERNILALKQKLS